MTGNGAEKLLLDIRKFVSKVHSETGVRVTSCEIRVGQDLMPEAIHLANGGYLEVVGPDRFRYYVKTENNNE